MKLAEQYEKPEFITDDPVQFPRRFGYKCSQEIVGFIAAWLAYGNRKAILSTCEKLCKEMERLTPYMYIKNMGWRKYIDSEEPWLRKRTPCVYETHTGAFPCFLQFLFRLRLRFNPYVGDRARKKRKINIRGVLIELLGFHV